MGDESRLLEEAKEGEMSDNENQRIEAEEGALEDKTERPAGRPLERDQEAPLFLRDRSDGLKGNAQDEKDEIGE